MVWDDLMEPDVLPGGMSGSSGTGRTGRLAADENGRTEAVMRRFRAMSSDRRPFYDAFVSATGGGKSVSGRWQSRRDELNGIGRAIGGVVDVFPASTGVRSADRSTDGAEPAFYRVHRDRMGRFSDRDFPTMSGSTARWGVRRQVERRSRPVSSDSGVRERSRAGIPHGEKKLGLNWNVEE